MFTDYACSHRHLIQRSFCKRCSTFWPKGNMATCYLLNSRIIPQTRGWRLTTLTPHPCRPPGGLLLKQCKGPTAEELLNPTGVTTAIPWRSAAASPVKQSPTPLGLAQCMSGQQMDASRNQMAHSKHTLSPAPLDPNKHAKTPTRECDDLTRQSRSMHRHCGWGGRSQS